VVIPPEPVVSLSNKRIRCSSKTGDRGFFVSRPRCLVSMAIFSFFPSPDMNHFLNSLPIESGRTFAHRLFFGLILLCGSILLAGPVCAQDESGSVTEEAKAIEPDSLSFPETESNFVDKTLFPSNDDVEQASGIDGRIGFIGLKAFGRDDSIVPVELFPYLQMENRILFGDIRGFISTAGKVGGNLGVGYRFLGAGEKMLFGFNGFYDADNSTGRTFQQMSVGWEARIEQAGIFGNVYMPVGTRDKLISQSVYNERFDGNNILFDVRSRFGEALSGLDLNFQAYLPGDFMKEHQVLATAGWYHFEGSKSAKTINGFKLQLQANIVPAIGTLTSVTRDQTYGTNFNIGIFWRFGTRELPGTSLHGQLRRFVDRNYNVILAKRTDIQTGVVAQNADGSILIVQHVSNSGTASPGTGAGTANDPYTTITDAQNAIKTPDLIFVHSGSVVNDSVVLADGQTLLGEGQTFQFRDNRYGRFYVPGGASAGTTPEIRGSFGDAVVMGNNSQIAGINIVDAGGRGIVAQNVDNVKISNVKVENSTSDAVVLDGVTGSTVSNLTVSGSGGNGLSILNIDDTLNLNNIFIEDTTGDGVHIDGGLGTISFTDELVIRHTTLAAFSVQNMEKLEEVDDQGTTSTLDDVTTITPSVISVEQLVIDNSGGTYGAGISSQNNAGLIGIAAVDITTEGAAALFSRNDNMFLIGNGYLNSVNAPVADVEGSAINVNLTQINADGGTVGMRFKDSTGNFVVFGDGKNTSSGGVIKNTDVAIQMENAGTVALQTVDFTNNGKMAEVNGGTSLIISGSTVTGTTQMLVDANNLTQLQILQSTFTTNPLASGIGIRDTADQAGTYTATISNNLITAMPGTFVNVQDLTTDGGASLAFAFQNNAVDLGTTASSSAVMVNWNGPLQAYVTSNTIVGTGTSQNGVRLTTGDGTSVGQVYINQNAITFGGANAIGIDFSADTPVNAIIDGNAIVMNGQNQIGLRASLGKASALGIADNTMTDNAGGATGMLFTSIEDGSQVELDNNSIDLSKFSTFVDQGIVISAFTAADGDPPVVTFFSTASNTINGATTIFSSPSSGGGRGGLIINNSAVVVP